MNIFYLDDDPDVAAQNHNDKHVVKMILEYAQMLSTAHRVLDGEMYIDRTSGRSIKRWVLLDEREQILYKATHVNHPSAKWARESFANYFWLYQLFRGVCKEYNYRYRKIHLTSTKLSSILRTPPKNIPAGKFTPPPQAMEEEYKSENTIEAYRNYYRKGKAHLAKWTKREQPEWVE